LSADLRLLVALLLAVGCGGPTPTAGPDTGSRPAPRTASTDGARSIPAAPREISFDDVKFDIAKDAPFGRELLPQRVTALDRQRVRIRGYILPSFQQTGLSQFVLVRDNMECCFGPGAAIYDCVVVRMLPGRTADFSIRPVAVTGRFRLEELRGPDGRHLAIYALDGEEVR